MDRKVDIMRHSDREPSEMCKNCTMHFQKHVTGIHYITRMSIGLQNQMKRPEKRRGIMNSLMSLRTLNNLKSKFLLGCVPYNIIC